MKLKIEINFNKIINLLNFNDNHFFYFMMIFLLKLLINLLSGFLIDSPHFFDNL